MLFFCLVIKKVLDTEAWSYATRALAQRWPIKLNLLLTALRSKAASTDILYIDIQTWLCLRGLIFSRPEVDMKIHFLLCAIKLHSHPFTCYHHYENPQARQSLHSLYSESSAVQIGTAFIIMSHVEATQAGGDVRESRCKYVHMWKVLNSTLPISTSEFFYGSVLWFGDGYTSRLAEGKLFISLQIWSNVTGKTTYAGISCTSLPKSSKLKVWRHNIELDVFINR